MTGQKIRPLKMTIPARLRPHIRASFAFNLGYGERAAVIYLLQKALEEEMMRDTANKLNKTRRLLEEAKP